MTSSPHGLDAAEFAAMVEQRYISVQKHPTADLWIYNYTPKAQFERVWNDATMACRGLICDGDGAVVARPFRKFFNWGERPDDQYPAEPFEVYDKLDGSLGILYWHDDGLNIATRGSFTSDQAHRATRILRQRYPGARDALNPKLTYLFEIIYPENRVVVNYGPMEDLILLAVIDPVTGSELPHDALAGYGLPVVEHYGLLESRDELPERENAEGFVLRWPSTNQRVKVKYAEYLRIHRLLTGMSTRRIWEMLRAGEDVGLVAERVPDEFHRWLEDTVGGLNSAYREIEDAARVAFVDLGDRKANALHYQTLPNPHLLFAMLDGKPYADMIWKQLRPEHERPFRVVSEDTA